MIKLTIAGDYVPKSRVAKLASEGRYDEVLSEVRAKNEAADYHIVNLECPVASTDIKPIEKEGFKIKCEESGLALLKYAGFDCVTLANNHFYDYGDEGVKETLQALDKQGLDHVGGGNNLDEASKTLYKEINGETLAIINCCEHEFSIATRQSGGSNPIDPISQYYAIREARSKASHVIVIAHGGIERYINPTPRMQQTYRFFIDAGADAVINHHQHCICGMETYKAKPIFYGLGNFCFDFPHTADSYWNEGYMVHLSLEGETVDYQISPYLQCNQTPNVRFLDEHEREAFDEKMKKLGHKLSDSELLQEAHERLMSVVPGALSALLTPYTSKWSKWLYLKRLLPSFYPREKWIALLNMVECESHRERLVHFIKEKLKK